VVWLAAREGVDPRRFMSGGVASLLRADANTRATVDVFQPQARELAALSARVKSAFDPRGLFNPGKMYKDL
jgi:glycolate oxidase FAD binding subunit